MQSTIRFITLLSAVASATLAAQVPAAPPSQPPRPTTGVPAAKLLLSNTGELELTDQQVVRLAAIARRSEARRKSLRAAMDSAGARFGANPADSTGRRQFGARMQADLQRAQEQLRTDERDAIAVLTPDQQARAWEMVSNRGRAARGGSGQRMRGMRGMRAQRPMRGPQRFREERREPMREPRPMRVPRPPED